MKIQLNDIYKAQERIKSVVSNTPLQYSRSCSERFGSQVFLKLENLQLTGSFKIRGALNKISSLTSEEKQRGIIASSAGNHAQGVAYSATQLGVKSTIVMPFTAPAVKVAATLGYGANVIQHGQVYDEAYAYAMELQKKHNYTFVHPYNDPMVMAGQGTIGLEVLESLPDVDSVVISIGGGGLISGIATAIKSLKPSCRIYGVQPKNANALAQSFKNKTLVHSTNSMMSIADGVVVKKPSEEILQNYLLPLVDDVVEVSEDEIAEAIVFLMERAKTITEGAGALPLAALQMLRNRLGNKTAVILCGGNIDLNIIERVVNRGLIKSGRIAEFRVVVEDKPGRLHLLTGIFGSNNCNILEVRHDRNSAGLEFGGTAIDFKIEVSGHDHMNKVKSILLDKGYRLLD